MSSTRWWLPVLVLLGLTAGCGSGAGSTTRGAPPPTSPSSAATSDGHDDPAGVTGRVTTGTQPCGILGAAGRVWVSDFGDNDLVALDPRTLHVGPSIHVGTQPCGLASGAGSIWVEDYGSGQVTRVAADSMKVQHTYRVGLSPYDVTFADQAAWVTNNGDGTVSRIGAADGRVTSVKVGGTPIGIAPSGGLVWVGAGEAGIVAIDPASSQVVHRIRTRGAAGWTAYDAAHVWVNVGASVWKIDGRTGRVLERHPTGRKPEDGSVVDGVTWVPDANGSLRRYGADVSAAPVASGVGNPFVLAGYRGSVWVVDFAGTDVVRIDPSRIR